MWKMPRQSLSGWKRGLKDVKLQYSNQVESLSPITSENHKHNCPKFSGMILFLTSYQNQPITLLPWQRKKQEPVSLAVQTPVMAHMELIV